MSFVVSIIIQVSLNKITLWISVGVDDWTAERAIIASYGQVARQDRYARIKRTHTG